VNKIKNYRKTFISRIPTLKYLDDRPVFDDDRRNAEAFSRGGLEEERKERESIAQEKRERDERNRHHFNEMIKKAREEKRLADEAKAAAERSASPVAEQSTTQESSIVSTSKEVRETDADDDAPPELEHVDSEQLKQEKAAAGDADKN